MDNNTQLYAETVRRLMETRSPGLFGNDRAEHAAIIFREFLTNAEKRVVILCRNMATNVFGQPEVIEALEIALRKKVAVDIVVQDRIESVELRQQLAAWKEEQLPITFVEAEGKLEDIKLNLAVMDATAFRLEPNNGETRAFACMNDPRSARILETQFYGYLARVA